MAPFVKIPARHPKGAFALADFKHRVKELTGRSWGVPMDWQLHKLGQYVRGWVGYFGISQYYRPVP